MNQFPEGIMDDELRKKVMSALFDKGIFTKPCPVCGGTFALADGIIFHALQRNSRTSSNSGMGVPCVMLICKNCGFVREHSLGLLGLKDELNKQEATGER